MKLISILLFYSIFLLSCNNSSKNNLEGKNKGQDIALAPAEEHSFFPVTAYLKGQINEIKSGGTNPLKINNLKNADSSWLKMEDLDNETDPFLTPVIDSISLSGLFKENSFIDQTIGALTLTYDPIKPLPDSFLVQRWDVYIDPESGSVKRIYIVRKSIDYKILQLTWQAGKSCKTVVISKDPKGNDFIEKDVTIKWKF